MCKFRPPLQSHTSERALQQDASGGGTQHEGQHNSAASTGGAHPGATQTHTPSATPAATHAPAGYAQHDILLQRCTVQDSKDHHTPLSTEHALIAASHCIQLVKGGSAFMHHRYG